MELWLVEPRWPEPAQSVEQKSSFGLSAPWGANGRRMRGLRRATWFPWGCNRLPAVDAGQSPGRAPPLALWLLQPRSWPVVICPVTDHAVLRPGPRCQGSCCSQNLGSERGAASQVGSQEPDTGQHCPGALGLGTGEDTARVSRWAVCGGQGCLFRKYCGVSLPHTLARPWLRA